MTTFNQAWPPGADAPKSEIENYLNERLSTKVSATPIIGTSQSTPPANPATADAYIVGPAPTGAFSGHENDIARWGGSSWEFTTKVGGLLALNAGALLTYDGALWVASSGPKGDKGIPGTPGLPQPPPYLVATVPSAVAAGEGDLVYITDEVGGSTVAASDGVNWRRSSDNANISSWIPAGASIHIDLENERFYWDGATRSRSDLIDNGDGSYDLNITNLLGTAITILTDYSYVQGQAPSGSAVSLTDGGGVRVEYLVYPLARLYEQGPGTFYFIGDDVGVGRVVSLFTIESNNPTEMVFNGSSIGTSTFNMGTVGSLNLLGIGNGARFPGNQLVGVDLHKITIYDAVKTVAEMKLIYNSLTTQFDPTLPENSWIPTGAALVADFENNQFFWDGAVRSISDLASKGGASYALPLSTFFDNGAATVVIDADLDIDAGPSGTIFSWSNPVGNHRFEIGSDWRIYINPPNSFASFDFNSPPTQVQSVDGRGMRRYIVSVADNQSVKTLVDNHIVSDSATIFGPQTPNVIGFGWRSRFDDSPLVNGTLHKVVIYDSAKTTTEMDALAIQSKKPPIHFLGDSFLNLHKQREAVMLLTSSDYIPTSQDGVGGSSLIEQAARFKGPHTKWHNSTLVIMDGGLTDTFTDAFAAIRSIVGDLPHERWIYVQSNQTNGYLSGRDDLTTTDARIRAFCGDHYVPTLREMQAGHDGSATDLAAIADGVWPPSLLSDTIHPNAAGIAILANVIYQALLARGFL